MTMRLAYKVSLAAVMVGTALCVSACGGSSQGLIPSASAGPLRSDFEAVAATAKRGNGNCGPTRSAIAKMERHYAQLPTSVDVGLREKIGEGIENLSARALSLCEEETTTSTTSTTTTVTTITEETEITATESEELEEPETFSTASEEDGGAEAPPEYEEEGENGEAGGTGVPEVEGEEEEEPEAPVGGAGAP